MTVECERWWAARYLLEHGHTAPAKPCDHPDCRPLKPKTDTDTEETPR